MPHIHDKIDFTVEVFVVFKNRVLLRFHDKYHLWLSVGGHIELDEDPNQAAIREVKEEVGLDIGVDTDLKLPTEVNDVSYRELIPPSFLNRHRINESHEHVTLTYFAKSNTDKIIPENKDDRWVWVTLKDLEKMPDIKLRVKNYAKRALEQLSK